ncbi:hypothetical protein ABPG72_011370 [Tetrahymena utriculariae]
MNQIQDQMKQNIGKDSSDDKENCLSNSNISVRSSRLGSTLLESKQICEDLKESKLISSMGELRQNSEDFQDSKIIDELTEFQLDQEDLNNYLSLDQLEKYTQQGEDAKKLASKKDAIILMGPTGSGKTTFLHFIKGCEMIEKQIEVQTKEGNYHKKKVIDSVDEIKNAKIGFGTVSETQFLNVIDIDNATVIVDTPGFKDNRSLEVDISNNINVMNVLKACKTVRIVLLISYHELMAERADPFRQTALIAAKMLNNDTFFSKNLQSVSVFYTHAQDIEIGDIQVRVSEVFNNLDECGKYNPTDRQILGNFLRTLKQLLNDKDSCIINPLNPSQKYEIMDTILKKKAIDQPDKKLNQFSFSQETENRIVLYCNFLKKIVVKYQKKRQFKEIFELLDCFQKLQNLIKIQQICEMYNEQLIQVQTKFKEELDGAITDVIESLKIGNIIKGRQEEQLKKLKESLCLWNEEMGTHCFDQDLKEDYLESEIKQKFLTIFNEALNSENSFDLLIQMVQSVQSIQDVLNESKQMMDQIKDELKKNIEQQNAKDYEAIQQEAQSQLENGSSKNQNNYQILNHSLKRVNKQNEILIKYQFEDLIILKKTFVDKIYECILKEIIENLQKFFNGLVQNTPQTARIDVLNEQQLSEILEQLEKNKNLYQVVSHFANSLFSENCEAFMINKEILQIQIKDCYCQYLKEFTDEFEKKKLKSKYLKQLFIQFISKYQSLFCYCEDKFYCEENSLRRLTQFYDMIIQSINDLDNKMKNSLKKVKEDQLNIDLYHFNKLVKYYQQMKQIKWIQNFVSGCSIFHKIDYFEEKISKIFSKIAKKIEEIIQQILSNRKTQELENLFKILQTLFNCLKSLNDNFKELIPKINDQFESFVKRVQSSFKNKEQNHQKIIQQLKEGKYINKDLLFQIEKTLIIMKYTPNYLIDDANTLEEQLVEQFDNLFKDIFKNMPNSNQWQLLLDKEKEYFMSWNELLERIKIVTSQKGKLSVLLEKSQYSQEIVDIQTVQNKITSIYDNLKLKMQYFSQNKEIVEAERTYKIINYMYECLSNLNLQDIPKLNIAIKQDINNLLENLDRPETLQKFKQNKQFLLDLKQIKDNPQQYEYVFEKLKTSIMKKIDLFIQEISKQKYDSSQSLNQIKEMYEWRELQQEVQEKEQLDKFDEEFKNKFQKEFNKWLNNNFAQYSIIKDQNNEVKKILKWFDDIIDFLSEKGFEIKSFNNLYIILIQNIERQVKQFKQDRITNWYNENFICYFQFIEELNGYQNFFQNEYCEKVQDQLNELKKFIDDEIQSLLNGFNNLLEKDPVDVSQSYQIIKVMNNLNKYDSIYNQQKIQQISSDLNNKLKEKINQQLNFVTKYIQNLEEKSDQDESQFKEYLIMLQKNDQKSFQSVTSEINKKFEHIKQSLSQIFRNQNYQINDILVFFHQLQKLNNLQQANTSIQNIQLYHYEINSIISYLKSFLDQFQEQIKNKQTINSKDFNNFCDLLKSIELLKKNKNSNLDNIDLLAKQIQEQLYQEVNKCIHNFQTSCLQNNYVDINRSIDQLKKIDDVIQTIRDQQRQNQDKIPAFINNNLWEFILKNQYSNIQDAKQQACQIIQKSEEAIQNLWQNKEFQKFVQYLKNLQQLENESNQTNQKNYQQIIIKYKNNINTISKEAQSMINQNNWNKQLNGKLEYLEDLKNGLDYSDLSEKINSEFEIVESLIQKNLNMKSELNQKKEFKDQVEVLINLRKISEEVPYLNQIVVNKVIEQIDLILKINGEPKNIIIQLSNHLQAHESSVAMRILKECKQFENIDAQTLKKKYENYNNFEYFKSNLQYKIIKDQQTKYQHFESKKTQSLQDYYNEFKKTFESTRKNYIINLKGINQIVEDVINKSYQKFDLNNWNKKMIVQCNYMLANICAYWALSYMRDNYYQELENQVKELYVSQVISIMILLGFDENGSQKLQNQLIQVNTGEGKSIIIGILSILLALMGYKVDVACYSQILSERDYESFKNLFIDFKVDKNIKYGTFLKICSDKINQEGDIRQLSKQLLNNQLKEQKVVIKEKCILIIDEVDVFFNESFYGQTYNPCCLFQNVHITKILSNIWKNKLLNEQTLYDRIISDQSFEQLSKQFPDMKVIFKSHIKSMIRDAQNIHNHQDYKYDKDNEKIGYRYFDDFNYDLSEGYSTIFAYFKEMEEGTINKIQAKSNCGINLSCGHYLYSELPHQYQNILGVTGTLDSLGEKYVDILKKYIQKACIIPSVFGISNLISETQNLKISYTKQDFFKNIMDTSKNYLQKKQPVLVFFKDNSELEEFMKSNYMDEYKEKVLVLNQQEKYKEQIIQKSCNLGQLTLCDKAFGRGTDFIFQNKKINENGGVVVLQTFFSEEINEEQQIKGRTARQGNKGIFIQHFFNLDLQKTFDISEQQLKEHTNMKSTYNFLKQQRNLLNQNYVKKIIDSSNLKKPNHDKTINYQKYLLQNKKEEALDLLKKFNYQTNRVFENLHFILILDDSGSMQNLDGSDKTRWQRVIDAVESFINQRIKQLSKDQDIISIVYYSDDSIIVAQYENLKEGLSIINNQKPRYDGTNFYLAIDQCINILKNENPEHQQMRKVILFLSDGEDSQENKQNLITSLTNLKENYKDKILAFWNIGFGSTAEQSILQLMADMMKECGGKFSTAINLDELEQKFQELAQIGQVMNMA